MKKLIAAVTVLVVSTAQADTFTIDSNLGLINGAASGTINGVPFRPPQHLRTTLTDDTYGDTYGPQGSPHTDRCFCERRVKLLGS